MGSGPYVSCVMTSLLQKQPWQSTFINTQLGIILKYKEPPKIFVITVEIPIPPLEVGKHMKFHIRQNTIQL